MITFKMNNQEMTMTNEEFCNMLTNLCLSVMREGKDWKEYCSEVGFEIVK